MYAIVQGISLDFEFNCEKCMSILIERSYSTICIIQCILTLTDELRMSQLQLYLRELSTRENKVPPPLPPTRQRSVSSDCGSYPSTHTTGTASSNNGGIYAQLEGHFFANIAKSQRLR